MTAEPRRRANPAPARRTGKQVPADTEQLSVYVPRQLAEDARNAVIATTPYARGYQGLSALVADALAEKLVRLQKQFNNGDPFPPRPVNLRRGRPLK